MNIVDFVIGYEEFKVLYLEAANNKDSATVFWNKYNNDPYPGILLINRQFLSLRDRLFALLTACKRIDANAFNRIHKGHPYYFIGISSYLLDDYQTAIYFLDAAVTEDINSGADPENNPTPSTRFLMLQGESNDQAAKQITEFAQAKVERALEHYHSEITKDPSISQLGSSTVNRGG
jgi:tetratricopeptide (TPR) repeat protein